MLVDVLAEFLHLFDAYGGLGSEFDPDGSDLGVRGGLGICGEGGVFREHRGCGTGGEIHLFAAVREVGMVSFGTGFHGGVGEMCTLDHRSRRRIFRGTRRGRCGLPLLIARSPGQFRISGRLRYDVQGPFTLSAHISWTVRHARQRRVSSFSASWEALGRSPFDMLPMQTPMLRY